MGDNALISIFPQVGRLMPGSSAGSRCAQPQPLCVAFGRALWAQASGTPVAAAICMAENPRLCACLALGCIDIELRLQGNELIAHTETVSGTYRVHPGWAARRSRSSTLSAAAAAAATAANRCAAAAAAASCAVTAAIAPADAPTRRSVFFAPSLHMHAETLETLGRVHYRDSIHGLVKSAHPHRLPNGDIIGMAADFYPVLDSATAQLVGGWVGQRVCPGLFVSWMGLAGWVSLAVGRFQSVWSLERRGH